MPPAVSAVFIIKHRHDVSRLAMDHQLFKRVQAGINAGRPLHRVDAANEIKCVDDE